MIDRLRYKRMSPAVSILVERTSMWQAARFLASGAVNDDDQLQSSTVISVLFLKIAFQAMAKLQALDHVEGTFRWYTDYKRTGNTGSIAASYFCLFCDDAMLCSKSFVDCALRFVSCRFGLFSKSVSQLDHHCVQKPF